MSVPGTVVDLFAIRLSDERVEQIRARITYCTCHGWKHGAIYHVAVSDIRDIEEYLRYYCGASRGKGAWWRKDGSEWAVEFAYQGDGHFMKPWEWCGKTILFPDWLLEVQEQQAAAREIHIGDTVSFTHRGVTRTGIVAGGRARASVIVGHNKWYVPFTDLSKL